MSMHSHIDYAYPWFLSYGHLLLTVIGIALCAVLWWFKRARLALIPVGAITLWAASATVVVFTQLNLNAPMDMPTQKFLSSGEGSVLDMGAGTGRSTIMLLENRPKATVVALDLFTEQYEAHFGKGFSGQEKLLANLQAAGVDNRATIQAGDMRKLPFNDATFDGIISAYAIDHLTRDGIAAAFSEAARVLKPDGEFLMLVIANDKYLGYTFGPLLMHSRMRASSTWPDAFHAAGFDVVEQGTRPATLYYVARKRPSTHDGTNKNDL